MSITALYSAADLTDAFWSNRFDAQIESAPGGRSSGVVVLCWVSVLPHNVVVSINLAKQSALGETPTEEEVLALRGDWLAAVEEIAVGEQVGPKADRTGIPPVHNVAIQVNEQHFAFCVHRS